MAYDGIITIGIVPDDSQLTRTLRHLSTSTSRTINQAINAHTQPLGRITGEASEFQKSLAASNARVIAFGASTGVIFAMKSAFQQLVRATIEVEQEMAEMNAIFQLGTSRIRSFSNELFAVANAYGMAFTDASKAAAEFARQGLTMEETLKRTAAALALSRVSGTNMEQSVASLTSILNTFVKESLDAEEVINRLVAVDQAFAVSAGDLAEALSRVSSSAADANISLNQTMGLIAAAKQITARSGSVIGNSFKTMFTRLQRPQVLEDLESVGVKARDAQGKLRPMMDVLKNLATSYDELTSSQRSFVAEAVGGVYQINILKAVMRDLGSGMSIVDGAMMAAGNSSDFVNKRMEVLNDTIASQLIRTANNLKLAFYNVGTAVGGGSMKTGIDNLDKLIRTLGKYSDATTASNGTAGEKVGANLLQGGLKGLGNFLKGPGIQFVMFALLKLFARLEGFIVQSAKDLVGVNNTEKQRLAINQGISEWLGTQKDLLTDILNGQRSLNDAARQYVDEMMGAVSAAQNLKSISEAAGEIAIHQVTFAPTKGGAAGGFIPSLEISEARRGGYQAGNILNTTISNGLQKMDVVANTAESVTRIMQDGMAYDYINPPAGTPAGRRHRMESVRQTGIDPYDMPNAPLRAGGFIPNLALSPEMIQTIIGLGIQPKDILAKASVSRMENFTNLPESVVNMFVGRYRHDPKSLAAMLTSMTRKGANAIPTNNGPAMTKFLEGIMLNTSAKQRGLFPDMSKAAVEVLAQALTGQDAIDPSKALATIAKMTSLRPSDVQKVLNLHAGSMPFIAGYESSNDIFSTAKDRPNRVQDFEFKGEGVEYKFKIPTPIFGFKGSQNIMKEWSDIEALMLQATKSKTPFTGGEIGATRGVFFEKTLRAMAENEGVKVGDVGSSLDIYGSVKSILSQTNIKGAVAGLELKASAVEAENSGVDKIFRTLAGEPGSRGKAALKGPVGPVPKLVNIRPFDMAAGGIGIIDADKYGADRTSDANYNALIYAAVGSGKPLRVHYGPMTMGKTTAAEKMVKQAGGGYITDISQIDSDEFKQFIINKTDRKNLDRGVFGLALASASQVRAFHSPYEEYKARHEEMVKRLQERNRGKEGKNAEAIAGKYNEEVWIEYAANIAELEKRLGRDRVNLYDPNKPFAAGGLIPSVRKGEARFEKMSQFLSSLNIKKPVESLSVNDYGDFLAYLESKDEVGLNQDLKNGYFGGAFPFGRKQLSSIAELLKRRKFNFAEGFIPNMFGSVADALNRENNATGGHAVLSSHPMLRTAQNPFGLAAIDSRSQSSAGEAIHQHLSIGQSLGEVRNAGSYVPNLATPFDSAFNVDNGGLFSSMGIVNSVMLAVAATLKQEVAARSPRMDQSRATGWLSKFTSEGERASAKLRLLVAEFSNAKEALIRGKDVQLSALAGGGTISGADPRRLKILESETKKILGPIRPLAEANAERRKEEAARISRTGLRIAGWSSFGGGVASQIAGLASPTAEAAVSEFTNGITQAGQVLLTFPNRFGWLAGWAIAGGAAVSATDVYRKNLQNVIRNFEIQNEKYGKLTAQLDSLSVSLNQYDSMIMDASVSAEAITREQRKYTEALAQMKETPEGSQIATRLAGAPDTRTRMSIIMEEKERAGRQNELTASVTALQRYADRRSFIGSQTAFGINPFGFTNRTQQTQIEHLMRSVGGAAVSNMSEPLKVFLSASTSVEDFSRRLEQAASDTTNAELSTSANNLISAFDNLSDLVGPSKLNTVFGQIRGQLITEAGDTTPAKEAARFALRERNAERQSRIDSAINQAKTAQRLFVNSGALQAGNTLDIRSFLNQQTLNQALVGGRGSIAERQAQAGVFRLQFGERTVRRFETSTELRRIEAERQSKVTQIQTESTRNIINTLTQDFESKVKNPEIYRNAGVPGGSVPTIGDFNASFIDALNKGITTVVKGGNVSRFVNADGSLQLDKFSKSIAASSSPNAKMQDNVLRYLQANSNIDILRSVLEANKQVVGINQDALAESQKQTQALQGLMAELDFKQLANFMGGIRNLLDRSSRRATERNLVRGATLLTTGRTAEARAFGAATFLTSLKDMNIPIDPRGGSPLSKMIREALSVGITNLAKLQSQSIGRVVGGIGRLTGGSSVASQAVQELAGRAGIRTAMAAFESTFNPENAGIEDNAGKELRQYGGIFQSELDNSSRALVSFAESINTTKDAWLQAVNNSVAAQTIISKMIRDDAEKVSGGVLGQVLGQKTSTGGQDTRLGSAALATGPIITTVGTGIAAVIVTSLLSKFGRSNSRQLAAIAQAVGAETTQARSFLSSTVGRVRSGVSSAVEFGRSRDFLGRPIQPPAFTDLASYNAFKAQQQANQSYALSQQRAKAVSTMEASVPENMQSLNAKQKSALYKQETALRERERTIRRQEARTRTDSFNKTIFTDQVKTIEDMEKRTKFLSGQPMNEVETKQLQRAQRDLSAAKPGSSAARKAQSVIDRITKRLSFGKGTALAGLIALGLAVPSLARAGQGGGEDSLSPNVGELAGLGIGTATNSLMMKTPNMTRLASLRKGGALALTGLVTNRIQDAIGGTGGELVAGGIDIAAASKFFGARGGAGAGIGVASELLRKYFTEKQFGYTAGAGQGMAGAMLAGAAFGGPIGSAISGGIYGVTEGMQMRAETNSAIADSRILGAAGLFDMARDIGGTNEGSARSKSQEIMRRLMNRKGELENMRQYDQDEFSGYSGTMMSLFGVSKRQFGQSESRELAKVTEQRERLGKAVNSGDTREMIRVLQEIQNELAKQARSNAEPEGKKPEQAQVNSSIAVDISVKDLDRIPSAINDNIIGPLVEQLAQLQQTVNELVNRQSPQPAQVR